MLVILWFMVLCFTVGAREQHEITDEAEQVLDDLYSDLNDETYILKKSKMRPKWIPRGSYHTYPEIHWSSTTDPEIHWSSTTDPEIHWSSTTEYTTVDHSEGQTDAYEHEHPVKEPSGIDYEHPVKEPSGIDYEHPVKEPSGIDYEHEHPVKEPSENDYEHEYPVQVGSIRGIPGITFPDYSDIPLTDFRCSDKMYVPGFYADMETGCQVFHVCWPHRRESFLCPVGTIFNQAILACDYWYSSNCSLASHYYEVNAVPPHADPDYKETASLGSMIDGLLEVGKSDSMIVSSESNSDGVDLSEILKFLPVKAKVVVYPETAESPKIIAEASIGKTKKSKVVKVRQKPQIHEEPVYMKVRRPHKVAPIQKFVPMKTKHSYKEIDRIIDRIFDIVKNILKETEGSLPVLDKGLQKGNQEHKKRKYHPLIKLNPRFIIKPAELPKQRKQSIQSTTETPGVQKPRVLSKPQIKVQRFPSKKHIISDFVSGNRHAKLSPSTKKTLTESYLKLIKTRST